jgi:starch phosphorylase
VRPRFYGSRVDDGIPHRWVAMVRHTLRSLGPQVLATRMVRDYVVQLYAPAAASSRRLEESGFQAARELADWLATVRKSWGGVRVGHVETSGMAETPQLGSALSLRALVDLGGLSPEDVEVEAAYGRVDEADNLHAVTTVPLAPSERADDGQYRYEGAVPLERTGAFGYTVRVLPKHALLASNADLGLLVSA